MSASKSLTKGLQGQLWAHQIWLYYMYPVVNEINTIRRRIMKSPECLITHPEVDNKMGKENLHTNVYDTYQHKPRLPHWFLLPSSPLVVVLVSSQLLSWPQLAFSWRLTASINKF